VREPGPDPRVCVSRLLRSRAKGQRGRLSLYWPIRRYPCFIYLFI
jgi:hypothetical protein